MVKIDLISEDEKINGSSEISGTREEIILDLVNILDTITEELGTPTEVSEFRLELIKNLYFFWEGMANPDLEKKDGIKGIIEKFEKEFAESFGNEISQVKKTEGLTQEAEEALSLQNTNNGMRMQSGKSKSKVANLKSLLQ